MNICAQFLDARLEEGAGDRIAIRTDERTWTVAALAEASSRWAGLLRRHGVTPGHRVLVALGDGSPLVAALFGTLRLGGVAVLANPALSDPGLVALAADLGARVIVVGQDRPGLTGTVPGVTVVGVGSPELDAELATAQAVDGCHPAAAVDDALWQLSSGTTGQPKAVRHTHGGILASVSAYGTGVLGLGPEDVTIAAPKLLFGYAAGTNLLFPLAAGGSAVLFPERSTAEALVQRIRRHAATVLVTTPAMVRQMVHHPTLTRADVGSLRLATSAGEALPRRLYERWMARFGVELLDGLGMTETCHIFISNRPGAVSPGTLGRVLPGYEVRLCDHEGAAVADGEAGELWVRGPSLAAGYWARPDAQPRVFRDGWCVSGDLVRRNADGTYTHVGRVDDLLKVNGKWVAPGVVEACLLEHPAVRDVAVAGVRDADGLVRPHAFVVSEKDGSPASAAELQAFARARLEPHAYPRVVVFLDELPRTAQGKLDRVMLSAPRRP